MYYKNAKAVCLVYDITSLNSFESLQRWMKEIEDQTKNSVLIAVVANKCDISDREEVSMK
jgi:GTPase SAR1 family protein